MIVFGSSLRVARACGLHDCQRLRGGTSSGWGCRVLKRLSADYNRKSKFSIFFGSTVTEHPFRALHKVHTSFPTRSSVIHHSMCPIGGRRPVPFCREAVITYCCCLVRISCSAQFYFQFRAVLPVKPSSSSSSSSCSYSVRSCLGVKTINQVGS